MSYRLSKLAIVIVLGVLGIVLYSAAAHLLRPKPNIQCWEGELLGDPFKLLETEAFVLRHYRMQRRQMINLPAFLDRPGAIALAIYLLGAAALLVATLTPSHAAYLSEQSFERICSSDDHLQECINYIVGVYSGIEEADLYADSSGKRRLICVPPDEPTKRLVDNVIGGLAGMFKITPSSANESAATKIYTTLRVSYPCRPAKARR